MNPKNRWFTDVVSIEFKPGIDNIQAVYLNYEANGESFRKELSPCKKNKNKYWLPIQDGAEWNKVEVVLKPKAPDKLRLRINADSNYREYDLKHLEKK